MQRTVQKSVHNQAVQGEVREARQAWAKSGLQLQHGERGATVSGSRLGESSVS